MAGDRLFWIVREHEGSRAIFLQRAQDKLHAWLHSAIAGHGGEPIEIYETRRRDRAQGAGEDDRPQAHAEGSAGAAREDRVTKRPVRA